MEKYFNITRDDLRRMIHEACRKIICLNESVYEGGAYGHMSHPFDVDEYTFGDYKKLVEDLFNARIERYSEKLDGMNIFVSVDMNGVVRFARNKGDIRNGFGGMDLAGIEARWGKEGDDPTVLAAYKNAYLLFTDVIKKLKNPVAFFNGDGYRIYANCEVIDPTHPNVIHYMNLGKTLSLHGLVAMGTDAKGEYVELPDEVYDQKMAVLERLLPDVKSQYGNAQITPEVAVRLTGNCEEAIAEYVSRVDRIEEMAGVDDNTTIIEYRALLLPRWLQMNGFGALIGNQFTEYFINRWIYGQKNPNIKQIGKALSESGIENWKEIYDLAKQFEGDGKKGSPLKEAIADIMEPIEVFFYSLGNEVIKGVEGYSNTGKETTVIDSYAEQLKATQEMLKSSGDIEWQNEMTRCLRKLAALGNKYNAMEGVVFNYNGRTFKLTGSFAALNRAINIKLQLNKKR